MDKTDLKLTLIIILFSTIFVSGCATVPRQSVIAQQPPGIYHIVGSGQTLYRIAKAYNADLNDIMRVNKISDPTKIGIGQKILIPGASSHLYVEPYVPISHEAVERIVGQRFRSSRWNYITLHHSATSEGNAECFDRNHRSRRMGGLFYHFVIGNGTLSREGEIEVGWRWRQQREANRLYDIQICLVGNFNKEQVSSAQFESLVKLINVLRKQYNIPLGNIRKHKDITGKATECPGNNFPFNRILNELKKR